MRGTPFTFRGFTGGLNTVAAPYELAQSETRDCLNVVSTQRGSIRKRYGSTIFSVLPSRNEFSSLASVIVNEQPVLIGASQGGLYSIDSAGAMTQIGKGFSPTARWSIIHAPKSTEVTGQGPVYLVNGVDAPQYWSGSGEVKPWTGKEGETFYGTAPHVPNGQWMVFAGNRIWMTGVKSDPTAYFWCDAVPAGDGSEVPDPSSWSKEKTARLESQDGLPITGIGVVGPYVVIFKESKTWIIYNLNEGQNRKLSDSIGCVAHRSIVESNAGTFFLTADQGVYLTNGSTLHEVSYNVRPTILAANPAQREHAAGAYFNNHYYLSYASGASTVPDRTLDYDVQLKAWWLHDLAANQWVLSQSKLYAVPSITSSTPLTTPGGIIQAFVEGVYTDSGETYVGANGLSAFWFSSWDPFGYYILRHRIEAPFLKKRVRQVHFDGEGEIIPIVAKNFSPTGTQSSATLGNRDQAAPELPVNFGAGGQVFGNENAEQLFAGSTLHGVEMRFGGVAQVQDARMYALGVGRAWSVGYGNASAEPFDVFSYMMSVSFRKS